MATWLQRGYTVIAEAGSSARQRLAYAAVAVITIGGLAAAPQLKESLLPAFKERDFLMHWITQPGTSVTEERRITAQSFVDLSAIPGVRNFGAHIGQALLADEVVGVNFGENWISIDPSVDYQTTRDAVQEVVDSYPGLYRDVQTYLHERINEVLSGGSSSLVVRVYGPDLPEIRGRGGRGQGRARSNRRHRRSPRRAPGGDPARAGPGGPRRRATRRSETGDVRRAAATLMAGEEVGDMFREGKAYDVIVWSTPATRANLTSIENLPIDTPGGTPVRLGDMAEVRVIEASNVVQRENDSRRIDVGADVRGRALGDVARDVEQRLQTVPMPLGYHAEVLGEYAERQAAQTRLSTFGIAAALGVLFLLVAAFGNWRLALLAFVTLPTALVGGVLAAFAGGGVMSLGSLVGFLTVFGIAARNGIMLISHYQHLERFEGEPFGPELILRGARERLSPILMTAFATGLAIVPLVVAGDIPGHEIEYPMAVVILGGLFTSTLLNLFVVPAIYLRFGRSGEPLDHREPARVRVGAPVGVTAMTGPV